MNTRPETPSQGIGLQEAANRFEALLSGDDPDTKREDTEAQKVADSDEAETSTVEATAADDAAEETPSEDDEFEDEAAEDDAIDDVEEEAEAPDDLDKLVTVKVDGKEEQVTLREALAGYSRTANYTREKMALADEKRAFIAEKEAFSPERDAIRLERQQYSQLLPVLVEELKATMQEPDWDALAANPTEFLRQQNLWRERQARIAAAEEEQARLQEIQLDEERMAIANAIRESGTKLAEAMPKWRDEATWQADRARMIEYGQRNGYSSDELSRTYDHRAIMMVYKAMRYDEIMAKRNVKPTPNPGPKPAPAGSAAQQAPRSVTNLKRAKQRLSKTGRVQDAASIFEALL